jgi:outer membrane lipoprotein-sorting protein
MIKGITIGSSYIDVSGAQPTTQYVNMNSNNPAAGQVRFNGNNMEVYDGNQWTQIMMNYATIGLNGAAVSALDWCQKKMAEESRINELAAKNVTVADALAKVEQAQEQLKMVLTLTEEA